MHDHIEIRATGGVVHVFPEGELDVLTAPALRTALEDAVALGLPRIVLTLRAVTFLDSTGLGAIVHGHRLATERGMTFHLAEALPPVRRVLVVTGLDGLVDEASPGAQAGG